ncbi:hypothetical protein PGT21_028566 [Puccinia graminis f. sp. tritici]|uniref:Uncharacterized protein n=1 Tax=Puccinia graminis f. sp. tritici TaxID=56615 RepID=A0A5B0NFI0_PUCGR|nr:hypothetical protein PGT21_028566 [Puccinia graminis f. sp. tritici]
MLPPTEAHNLPQISGWVKIHSLSPHVCAHDTTQINDKDFLLSIIDSDLKRLNPELQITSHIWINAFITRSDSKFIYLTVKHLSYNAPLN